VRAPFGSAVRYTAVTSIPLGTNNFRWLSPIVELFVAMGVVTGAVLAGSEGPVVAEGFATAQGEARRGGHNSPMSPAICARIEL